MNSYRVGIASFGAIGQSVAQSLNAGLPGLSLAAVAVRDPRPARLRLARAAAFQHPGRPARALRRGGGVRAGRRVPELAEPVLRAGKKLVVLSSARCPPADLIELARQHGAQIIVPSGAILGLDAITAAAEGGDPFGHDDHARKPCAACWAPPIWRTTTST